MPDLFGGLKAVGSAVVGAAGDALEAVTPGAIKDKIFGSTSVPPTPTTPEAAQNLLNAAVGTQPDDDQILKNIQALGQTSSSVSVLDAPAALGLQGMPYDPHTSAQVATGSNVQPPDPLTLANPQLQAYFKAVPRAQLVFAKNYLATDPNAIAWAVAQNTKAVPGLLSEAVSKFADLAGRPIGGTLDMLSKPSAWIETWYGTHFIFNDVADTSLRQVMARHSYDYGTNFGTDMNFTQLRRAQAEAIRIEQDMGLKGPAAAAEYERWYKAEGNPGWAAHVVDGFNRMVIDPLWLIPAGAFGDAARAGMKGATGTEDVSKLFRLWGAPGLLGDFAVRQVLTLGERD